MHSKHAKTYLQLNLKDAQHWFNLSLNQLRKVSKGNALLVLVNLAYNSKPR